MILAQDVVDLAPDLDAASLVLRLGIAAVLGGLIGLERELSEQPAGLRTHLLVSLGSALFSLVGAYAFGGEGIDATRVAAQVVTGIGFIGAGVIFQQGASIRGLTTAAALWVTAAVGMAAGFGMWMAASVTAVITIVSLYGLKRFQQVWLAGKRQEREGPDPEEHGAADSER